MDWQVLTNLQFGQRRPVAGLPSVTCKDSKVGICNHLSPLSLTHFWPVDASFKLGSHLEHLHVASPCGPGLFTTWCLNYEDEWGERNGGKTEEKRREWLERENEDIRWNGTVSWCGLWNHIPLLSPHSVYGGSHKVSRRGNSPHLLMGSGKILEDHVDLELLLLTFLENKVCPWTKMAGFHSWMWGCGAIGRENSMRWHLDF